MKQSRIFISYSVKDISFAKSIVLHLKEETGIDPWIDLSGIMSGDKFINVLVKAIDQADIVVFLLSHNSINSTFAQKEVQYANNTHKRLCPVLIDTKDCISGWFLFMFGETDYIDYFDPLKRNKFFDNIREWLGLEVQKKNIQIGMSDIEAEELSVSISVGASQNLPPEYLLLKYKDFLFRKPEDNWTVYFRIGSELAKNCREIEGGNEFAILAYSRAFECSFDSSCQNMKARALILRGSVKRRIGDLEGALQDLTIGEKMVAGLEKNDIEMELVSYNLAILSALNKDFEACKCQIANLKHYCRDYMLKSYLDSIIQVASDFPKSEIL